MRTRSTGREPVIGMHYTYFAARSEAAAAAVMNTPAGAVPDDGVLSDAVPGVQFSQELGRFAALLTGEDIDLEDGDLVVAETDDGMDIVCRVPTDLVRLIADAEPSRLHELVPEWSEFEDFADPDQDRLRAFVDDLQRLTRAALQSGGGVYSHGSA
jgi:hypothetical protein